MKIVGFGSNCCDFLFDPKGIRFEELIERLEGCTSSKAFIGQQAQQPTKYAGAPSLAQLDELQDLPIPILVDCSAQTSTQELYSACIERGIHVRAQLCGSLSSIACSMANAVSC